MAVIQPAPAPIPPCPYSHTVDLLWFLGSLRQLPDLAGHVDVEGLIWWITGRINNLAGVSRSDLLLAIVRLTQDESLEGQPHTGGYYGQGREDLNHVAVALRSLDGATLKELWAEVCRQSRVISVATARNQARIGKESNLAAGTPTGPAPTDPTPSPGKGRKVKSEKPEAGDIWGQVAQAIGDGQAAKIIAIAQRTDLSAEEKMKAIVKLDSRFKGKNSPEWGKLLGVTPEAVRLLGYWRELQDEKRKPD
jgi:hypothetical protein